MARMAEPRDRAERDRQAAFALYALAGLAFLVGTWRCSVASISIGGALAHLFGGIFLLAGLGSHLAAALAPARPPPEP